MLDEVSGLYGVSQVDEENACKLVCGAWNWQAAARPCSSTMFQAQVQVLVTDPSGLSRAWSQNMTHRVRIQIQAVHTMV